MSGQAAFDYSELSEYTKKLLNDCNKNFPKEYDNFLKSEARKVNKTIKNIASVRIIKRTGNYLAGAKVGKIYDFAGTRSIRAYAARPAYHAHLIEYGHKTVHKKWGELSESGKRRRKKLGLTPISETLDFNVYSDAREQSRANFEKDFSKFYDKLLKKAGNI